MNIRLIFLIFCVIVTAVLGISGYSWLMCSGLNINKHIPFPNSNWSESPVREAVPGAGSMRYRDHEVSLSENSDNYLKTPGNGVQHVANQPLSTFSIDIG